MKIGIIGAGNIGATLARKLAASGHEVKLANSKGPDAIRDLARDAGAAAVSKEQAVEGVEAIVLSIPFARFPELSGLFADVPGDVAVIDTSNYYPFRDGAIVEVDGGKPESLWVCEQIGRPVVKSWNAVLAATLAERGRPKGASGRIAIPVAGDDPKAKAIAMELVEATGFDAIELRKPCRLLASATGHPRLLHRIDDGRAEIGAAVRRPLSRARQSRRPSQGIHGSQRRADPRRDRRPQPGRDCMITAPCPPMHRIGVTGAGGTTPSQMSRSSRGRHG